MVLNVGAVVGLVCIVVAAVSMLLGVTPLVFRSGSMSPEIPTGSLALSRSVPASEITVGDVVSVDNQQGVRITHRVVDLVPAPADLGVVATLQGDANPVPDVEPYVFDRADRVFFHVPGAGYAVSWLTSPVAIFLGGVLVGAVVVLAAGYGPLPRRAVRSEHDYDVNAEA
ncbi:signal peptidase I [Dietzia alimentaria]|uniref:signal peptidase I n=1 Tax=Dietzia alimentaria TaxID=665550 RepID=UPI00029A6B22|nr:signal peptidase I [Dietzia alimentaria]